MISITINGTVIQLDGPMTVLKAARQAGIKIPTLCNHDLLKPYGGCRLCVVEVERMPKLQNACTLLASDGMVINTEAENISKARRGILELLLINHPLDCPYCDKAGECELQDLVEKYGPSVGRYTEEKRKAPESHEDKIFARNMERCVVCTRCVRMCDTVQGASAIDIVGRGNRSRMEPFSSASFDCEYCGNCLTVCPVGAILSRLYIHSYRPWQIDKEIKTICPYCGVGCSLVTQVRDNLIKRIIPKFELGLNNGLLCSRGRFGYEFVNTPGRLKHPLIKKNNRLEQSTWDEAFAFVAEKLVEIRDTAGGKAISGIASPRCTNEDNYVFQKFMRMACRTNNIDSVSRTGFGAAQKYVEDILGQGITANLIAGLRNSSTILVAGGDPTAVNPILGLAIRAAARNGAKIAVLGNAKGLEKFKPLRVVPPIFREPEVLEAVLSEISKVKGPRGEKPAVDRKINTLSGKAYNMKELQGFNELKEILLESSSVSIVTGMDLVQRTDGHRALFAIAGLTYLLEARLYLLSGKPNEQGLIDMGCQPDMLPGGRPVDIVDFKRKFESSWNGQIPEDKGLTIMEMIDGMKAGDIKALYVMGENPVFNLPDSSSVRDALKSLDLLIVQDMFFTDTAKLADVVFPAAGWSEKKGTYTNLERRIQLLNKIVDTPAIDDWRIISGISEKMGYKMNYSKAENVMEEIAGISPLYRDLTYKEIERGDCLWPYNGEPLRGELKEIPSIDCDRPEYEAESYLGLEDVLFHSGTLSTKSSALRQICPEPSLKIGADHAEKLGVKDGDTVNISTGQGNIDVQVSIEAFINDNKVLLGNNFEGKGAYSLMGYSIDPVTKAPGTDGCEVLIKRRDRK